MVGTAMVHRVFRLRITPERAPDVYRTIDFDGRHTLDDVHVAIQREFELNDDHLHAFYLSGEYFDRKTEVEAGERRGQTARRPLFRLGLKKGGHFAYLFDFGDELRHRIDVVDVVDVSRPIERPTLVEAMGAAPPQYDHDINDGFEHDDNEIDDGLAGDGFGEDEKVTADAELEARVGVLLPIAKRLDAATSEADPTSWALSAATDAALELALGLAENWDLLAELEEAADCDVVDRLLDLPRALAKAGRIDDAEAVTRSFAPFDSENLLGDLGVLLAEAGKGEAALQQVEHNLELYGDDDWVRIKAGDVFTQLGIADRAETEYRQVFDATRDPFTRAGVLERLCPLLEAQGRAEEAKALLAVQERKAAPTAVRSSRAAGRSAPKVGRNDPCPCGSGRKFKKCCGGP